MFEVVSPLGTIQFKYGCGCTIHISQEHISEFNVYDIQKQFLLKDCALCRIRVENRRVIGRM